METSPDPRAELLALCDRLLDGEMTSQERERLEELVLNDAGLRRTYIEYLHLHTVLRSGRPAIQDAPLAEIIEIPEAKQAPFAPGRTAPHWLRPALAAAACIALLAGGAWLGSRRADSIGGSAHFAILKQAKATRWDGSDFPTTEGASLGAGHLRLAEGLATLVFARGAELTLEGPADLELLGADRCFLHSGAAVAHVPPQAVGFTVGMPHAQVIDHGTDFAVSASANTPSQVQVLKGEVELRHSTSGEALRLSGGESASLTEAHLLGRVESTGEANRGSQSVADSPDNDSAVTITTRAGAGRAAYVVHGALADHSTPGLLMVKHATARTSQRKAYLGFDLGAIRGRRIDAATVTLVFAPTGWGFASLVNDARFTVYGVTDPALNAWSPETLTWENAPANVEAGNAVDPQRAQKLGSFVLPQGVLSGPFSISGPALTDFLNRSADGFATLIVVRETPETAGGGVVHGFAGNDHPTLAPPTLRLRMAR